MSNIVEIHCKCKGFANQDEFMISKNARNRSSEVAGEKRSGAETPTGNPSPAPIAQHPHRTHRMHNTLDQWHEVVHCLGQFLTFSEY